MGKSRSVPYHPIIPPPYDPYAREKERERAKREDESYFLELEADRRRENGEEYEDDQWRRDWLAANPDYGPDHPDWGKY